MKRMVTIISTCKDCIYRHNTERIVLAKRIHRCAKTRDCFKETEYILTNDFPKTCPLKDY